MVAPNKSYPSLNPFVPFLLVQKRNAKKDTTNANCPGPLSPERKAGPRKFQTEEPKKDKELTLSLPKGGRQRASGSAWPRL